MALAVEGNFIRIKVAHRPRTAVISDKLLKLENGIASRSP